jgi:hypothetical protein
MWCGCPGVGCLRDELFKAGGVRGQWLNGTLFMAIQKSELAALEFLNRE